MANTTTPDVEATLRGEINRLTVDNQRLRIMKGHIEQEARSLRPQVRELRLECEDLLGLLLDAEDRLDRARKALGQSTLIDHAARMREDLRRDRARRRGAEGPTEQTP